MSQSVLEMTKDLVLVQIQTGRLSPENVHEAMHRTYQNLMKLKTMEETGFSVSASVAITPGVPVDWRKSIARYTVTCLECGVNFKHLSAHLRRHGLNARTYRIKYGIPQSQPLASKDVSVRQRETIRRTKPWELTRARRSQAQQAAEAAPEEVPKRKRAPRARSTHA